MGFWPVVNNILKKADIVLIVLDARMPALSRNSELERKLRESKKEVVFVFNKIDLVSNGALNDLRKEFKNAAFVSGSKNIGINRLKTRLNILAKRTRVDGPSIGVVGYPNVGKSSVINALAKRGRARVGKFAGTTKGSQWVRVGGLRVIDSPGVVPFDDNILRLGLLGAKDPEKLKFPEKAADKLIKIFLEGERLERLRKFYKAELEGDSYEILLGVGRKRGFLMRGGEVDERKTAIQILRDWQKGKLRF